MTEIPQVSSNLLVDRLRSNLDALNAKRDRGYEVSMSVGMAFYDPEDPCSLDELLIRADTLMYRQKKNMHRG
jgi:GGDEF domain-containing protein